MAIQYANEHEADYPGGYCWLTLGDAPMISKIKAYAPGRGITIPDEFGGQRLTVKQQAEYFWRNWKPPEGLALVILDDLTEESWETYKEAKPTEKRFRVLITTRLQDLDPRTIEEINLDVLSPDDALELLSNTLTEKDDRIKDEPQAAQELCKNLGYLPLALELVGYYLVYEKDISLSEVLEQLKANRLDDEALERNQDPGADSPAQLDVKDAFKLSWEKFDSATRLIGQLLSLFDPVEISWDTVESISESLGWTVTDIKNAKKQLNRLHFIKKLKKDGAYYNIHPLVRDFMGMELERSGQADDIKGAFVEYFVAIAKIIPRAPTLKLIQSVKDDMPHLTELKERLIGAVNDEDLTHVFIGLARFYEGQGLYALAQPLLEQSLSVMGSRLGDDHPVVTDSRHYLAKIHQLQGQYSRSVNILEYILSKLRLDVGHIDAKVADILGSLGNVYYAQGQYKKAQLIHQEALEIQEQKLGNQHLEYATILGNLALDFTAQGKYAEARVRYEQALKIEESFVDKQDIDTSNTLNNLAGVYIRLGQYSEAQKLYEQALEQRKAILGDKHPEVAASLNNLASVLLYQSKYDAAQALFNQVLEIQKFLARDKHLEYAITLSNLAIIYKYKEKYGESEELHKEALNIKEKFFDKAHPSIAGSIYNLANVCACQKKYEEALTLFERSLEMRESLLGNDHPHVGQSLEGIASVYASQDQRDQAKHYYLQALKIYENKLGEYHPETLKCKDELAKI
ncbi:tetratricopeptide repeat protein [Aetokthonos hydrillicola]|uniref:tetratricopeptide repeat protein n=1 Tax=Aetokthonos hydrillicola TaxID=1550245 RepID=UPI001ABB7604|nr:tetratricopeptide repeat protein [Aetokthonos hydrillicola]MBO3462107.1 tetratricopeptide repeat protein [Aetokthonos hydrillicola CCALA 1050]